MVKNRKRLKPLFGIEDKLIKLCKKCDLKEMCHRCPFEAKMDCKRYMGIVVTEYLKQANDEELEMIPWELFARGLQAHDITGDLHQVKYVQI